MLSLLRRKARKMTAMRRRVSAMRLISCCDRAAYLQELYNNVNVNRDRVGENLPVLQPIATADIDREFRGAGALGQLSTQPGPRPARSAPARRLVVRRNDRGA